MTPADAYQEYISLVRHFKDDKYDWHKYQGKVRLSRATFDSRPDRWVFEKLARRPLARWMIIGCLLNDRKWVGDMVTDEAEELATLRMGKAHRLSYLLQEELADWGPIGLNALIDAGDGPMPALIEGVLQGRFSIETVAAIAGVTGCSQYWEGLGDPLTKMVAFKARKYYPFMQADERRVKQIMLDTFRSRAA